MVNIRSLNEIILNMIDYYRTVLPEADTSPGSVIRDLMVDGPSAQISLLYDELAASSNQQSLRLVVGSDLDKLGQNYGLTRKQATPSSGVSLLTFSSINSNININKGDTVIANNGLSFAVVAGISVTPASINFYKSVAAKFRDQLDFAGISDEYAVEVTTTATTAGTAGNIGSYSLSRTNIAGVSNVTNINPFNGGTDQENDALFRNRILASFNGSSVGTALGYLNAALSTTGVLDATVIEPGSPLMTRDGTQVQTNADGSKTVISEGTGGKVDVVVLGQNLIENTDTFIYKDKSNNNDPTSSKNDIVLGQIAADANKTINKKRVDDIKNGTLPAQPVDTIIQVTGSISGSNFVEKTVDEYGRVSGNYELVKDTGVYGGSPWGFDTFHWVSDHISQFGEDRIKGQFNGQDPVTFMDVTDISNVQQNLSITNENSIVTNNRSIIQVLHVPMTNVTRVFNVNTGERYVIINQNVDQTGLFNTTGRVQISGNTLPTQSDVLQVDYSWIINYDRYTDFDGLKSTNNPREVNDSVDWGYASNIKNEEISFSLVAGNNFFQGTASQPVGVVISANTFYKVDCIVSTLSSGTFVNRKCVIINNLNTPTNNVSNVRLKNSNVELFATAQANNTFFNDAKVFGTNIVYNTTVILPSDTTAQDGQYVTVILNNTNIFSNSVSSGSSNGNQITIPTNLINTSASSITLLVSYISSVSDLFNSAITSLPASHVGNGYLLNNNLGFNNLSQVNMMRREGQTIQKNLSNQYFTELSLPFADYSLSSNQIVRVIRISDGKQLWNDNEMGSIATNSLSGNYQIILDGYNSPAIGDKVLAFYYATDIRRFEPFSYSNKIIKSDVQALTLDGNNDFSLIINNFTAQASNLHFTIFDENIDGYTYFTVPDGYLSLDTTLGVAKISSVSINFSTLADISNKKVRITGASNISNNGIYDILSYNSTTNILKITNICNNLTKDQISVIRLFDGKELWTYNGSINTQLNTITIPFSNAANIGDKVFINIFNFKNLRQAPTKIIGNITDQVSNNGIISINGTTLTLVQDAVFTATNNGLSLNLSEALRKNINIPSTSVIPDNLIISKIIKVEKVITASNTDDTVLEVLTNYDVKNTTIKNNLFYCDEMLADATLQNLDFILPNTQNNTLNVQKHNVPKIGDKIRVSFYYSTLNDNENLSYTRNGSLYTNKKFAIIDKIFVSSGFKTSQSTRFTASSFTQPGLSARYKVFYDYLAPKQNERIAVRYNYNKLLTDVSFNIENTRPINADILAREAKEILLDLTINVVIEDSFKNSTANVLQNLRDKLTSTLTTTSLGNVIDTPTIINVAESVTGIARARILYFNKTGSQGSISKFQAQDDEYFAPNTIIINTETR